MPKQTSSVLSDQPAQKDALDFDSFAQALHTLIVDENTKTPLTLGIFGRWGTGKTTLMYMLNENLEKDGLITIWFNAWQYSKEDELWAAFLQSIINKIEGELNFLKKLHYKIKLLFKRIKWRKLPGEIIQYLFRALLVILPLLLIDPLTGNIQPAARPVVQAGGQIATAGLAIWLVIKPLIESVQENVTMDFEAFKDKSDYQKHVAFLDKFRDHFADIVSSLPNPGQIQLAVFIDDLDRCPTERILQVLDAIKLFLDIPGCIFILGLDVEIVQKAVADNYKDDLTAQREYLGKIVQLPFQLPPLTYNKVKEFLQRLSPNLPDERCREVFVAGLNKNPREVKRAINIFSLVWNLSNRRPELEIKPVRLAKVIVIQHGHPDLYKLLQQRPDLLAELEQIFRAEKDSAKEAAQAAEQSSNQQQFFIEGLDLARLHQMFIERFSESDLRSLTFYLNIDYEELAGEGVASKARELIQYVERRGRIHDLLEVIQRSRPDIFLDNLVYKEPEKAEEPNRTASGQSSSSLDSYLQNDQLRRMLLLHYSAPGDANFSTEEEIYNFADLNPADIEPYFTLTSAVEAPIVDGGMPNLGAT